MRRLLVVLLITFAAVAGAQDLRVGASTGAAEIELPGSGWLQAVSGRAVPSGVSLATWTDGAVTVVAEDLEITLGELSVISIEYADEAPVSVVLETGAVVVRVDGTMVELTTGAVVVSLSDGELRLADGVLTLVSGQATAELGTAERLLVAPARFDTSIYPLNPVF